MWPAAALVDCPCSRSSSWGPQAARCTRCEPPCCARCARCAGFMGLAVSMLSDERWRKILEREDPPSFFKAVK